MRKLCFLTLLLLCLSFPISTQANVETYNWCGTYFEKDDQGFIRIPMADLRAGSSNCDVESYSSRILSSGTVNIALGFTKSRSAVSNWRKFNNHLLEVRGKLKNGEITSTRLIRDVGP